MEAEKNVFFYWPGLAPPPPKAKWPHIISCVFFELQKKDFCLSGPAFTLPPPPLKTEPFFGIPFQDSL